MWMRSASALTRGHATWHLMGARLDWLPDAYRPRCGTNAPYRLQRAELTHQPPPHEAVCVRCLALSQGLPIPAVRRRKRTAT